MPPRLGAAPCTHTGRKAKPNPPSGAGRTAAAVLAALWRKPDPTLSVASGTEKTIADRHKTRVVRFTASASDPCNALQVAMSAYIGDD